MEFKPLKWKEKRRHVLHWPDGETAIPSGARKKKPQKPYLNCNHSKQRKWRLAQLPAAPADKRTDKWKYHSYGTTSNTTAQPPPTRIVIHVAGGVFFFGIFVNSVSTAHMMMLGMGGVLVWVWEFRAGHAHQSYATDGHIQVQFPCNAKLCHFGTDASRKAVSGYWMVCAGL